MNIEAALTQRIGPAGAKLHTARSRNDQVALDLRLYLRAEIAEVRRPCAVSSARWWNSARGTRRPSCPATRTSNAPSPCCLPIICSRTWRCSTATPAGWPTPLRRLDVLPLGSGAIAGSTVILDRHLVVAAKLGFSAVSENSMDAVSDRDFACEFLAAAALVGMHLSRLSEDVILWATSEFRFVTL